MAPSLFTFHIPYVSHTGGKADARSSNRASLRSETHQCTEHHSLQLHACFSSGMPSSNLGNTTLTHISVACNLKISQNIAFFSKNVFFYFLWNRGHESARTTCNKLAIMTRYPQTKAHTLLTSPGGLSKGRQATRHRTKLLRRPLGLRALNQEDYVPPVRLWEVARRLFPEDNLTEPNSLHSVFERASYEHRGPWLADASDDIALAVLKALKGTLGFTGWVLSTSRVDMSLLPSQPWWWQCCRKSSLLWRQLTQSKSLLMYKALVSVRYPELVALTEGGYQIGHFVPHPHTDQHGGFLAVFWDVPLDLTTCQLLVLRNRDLLLQHGFTSEWEGGIRVSSVSSAAGATAIGWLWLFETGGNSSVATGMMLHPKAERTVMAEAHSHSQDLFWSHTWSPHSGHSRAARDDASPVVLPLRFLYSPQSKTAELSRSFWRMIQLCSNGVLTILSCPRTDHPWLLPCWRIWTRTKVHLVPSGCGQSGKA